MKVSVRAGAELIAASDIIFSETYNLSHMQRLYLQTWMIRLHLSENESEIYLHDFLKFLTDDITTERLLKRIENHPRFMERFGNPLRDGGEVIAVVREIIKCHVLNPNQTLPEHISDMQEYLNSFDIADVFSDLLAIHYPENVHEIEYYILPFDISAYNFYPNQIAHFKTENKKYYVAGYGHEGGHILTWDICQNEETKSAFSAKGIKNYPERIAELCTKLVLDSYGIKCKEVFDQCSDWDEYLSKSHPDYRFFMHLIDVFDGKEIRDLQRQLVDAVKGYKT